MRIGFVQMTPVFGETCHNVNHAEMLIRQVTADLLVLPEFFATGYLFTDEREVWSLAEPVEGGYTTGRLVSISRETGTALVAGLPERAGKSCFNSAVMVTPEGDLYVYRKTHLFDREKLFFNPGDTGFEVFTWRDVRVGIMICFDWFFPESARTLALAGAQIITHPSNLVLPHCPQAMVTRCLENRVFAVTANRGGSEKRGSMYLNYIGNSRIIDPGGKVLGQAGDEETAVVITDVNPWESDNKQITSRNDLFADRRSEQYRLS
ncbi:acyltransferase [bacterium]|nr:acyltransferase [candidate division CSSED10-310 bacterium]